LHPAILEHGLGAALNALATRAGVATTVAYDVPVTLPQPVELAAYFVACEALTNVAKYAGASGATIRAWHRDGAAVIEIADDGVGGAEDSLGSGFRGLADRVEALDGRLARRQLSRRGDRRHRRAALRAAVDSAARRWTRGRPSTSRWRRS
jgi:signal transduction histidine kinase